MKPTSAESALATMPLEARRTLEWVFQDTALEIVEADLARIRNGERYAVLGECLDGADDTEIASWQEYVAHLVAHADCCVL